MLRRRIPPRKLCSADVATLSAAPLPLSPPLNLAHPTIHHVCRHDRNSPLSSFECNPPALQHITMEPAALPVPFRTPECEEGGKRSIFPGSLWSLGRQCSLEYYYQDCCQPCQRFLRSSNFSPRPNGVNPPPPGPTRASIKHYTVPRNNSFSSKAKNFLCCLVCAKADCRHSCDSAAIDARPDQNLRYRLEKSICIDKKHHALLQGEV